jgi:histidyl-tRNA synthetase
VQYADKRGIPLVAFLGPDEAAGGVVNLRSMASGEQSTVRQSDAAVEIMRLLGA